MRNRKYAPNWAALFFMLTLALALCSWVGGIYGAGEVQSLLSAEGVRWILGHVVKNYVQAPALGAMLVLLMGAGVVVRSGLYDVLRRLFRKDGKLSRKERRALVLASVALLLYVSLIGVCVMLPSNLLLGVTGSWYYSPLMKGTVYILAVGVGLSAIIYGYVTDAIRSAKDWVDGMTILIARHASFFVSLFFVVQFFSSLSYTRLAEWLHVPDGVMEILYQFFCYLPLFV